MREYRNLRTYVPCQSSFRISTRRRKIAMTISTVHSKTTAVAQAEGYKRRPISFEIKRPTLALWLPLIKRTVMKSPITNVTTNIVPIIIPGLQSGMTTFQRVCNPLAPPSTAASNKDLSIRIIELKIGTTINSV